MTARSIATVEKNASEEIRVVLDTFKGHHVCDVRIWTDPYSGGDERVPTKRGISFRVDRLADLIDALERARAAAEG